MKAIKLINSHLIILLYLTSILLSLYNFTQLSLINSIISSLILIFWLKNVIGNYTNTSYVFIVFSTLYGVSGPINVIWGEGLHRLFSTPYNIDAYLISYAIANIGFIIGVVIYNLINNSNSSLDNSIIEYKKETVFIISRKIFNAGLVLALFASIFELINLFRIGGFSILFAGKATYQSLESALILTLPSSEIMIVAFSLIGLYLGVIHIEKVKETGMRLKITLLLGVSTPFLLIKIILGQRGTLITLFICILIGITYFKPMQRIKPKLIFILVLLYVFLGFLFANRGIVALIPRDSKLFFEMAFDKERIVNALNPGANEFGAAFGNFNEYYNKVSSNSTPRLGETYIKALVVPIPSFVYPGTKPKQITYEFRDEFFISEASRGAIAGTGFSSILEAYINYKNYGVFFIYLFIGFILQKVDRYYRYKSLFFMIMYTVLFSLTMSFHRSAFGTIFGNLFLNAILIYVIIMYINVRKKLTHSYKNS